MDEYVPRYKWRRTWGDETGVDGKPHEDFAGFDRDDNVGRIYKTTWYPIANKWKWNAGYPKQRRGTPALPNAGFAESPREACRLCEEYYDRMLASNGSARHRLKPCNIPQV